MVLKEGENMDTALHTIRCVCTSPGVPQSYPTKMGLGNWRPNLSTSMRPRIPSMPLNLDSERWLKIRINCFQDSKRSQRVGIFIAVSIWPPDSPPTLSLRETKKFLISSSAIWKVSARFLSMLDFKPFKNDDPKSSTSKDDKNWRCCCISAKARTLCALFEFRWATMKSWSRPPSHPRIHWSQGRRDWSQGRRDSIEQITTSQERRR